MRVDELRARRGRIARAGLLLGLVLGVARAWAGEACGPACPMCSGGFVGKDDPARSPYILAHTRMSLLGVYAPGSGEIGTASLSVGLWNRLEAGIVYGFGDRLVSARAKVPLNRERGFLPAFVAGLGGVRPTEADAAVSLTVNRDLNELIGRHLMLYAGAARYLRHDARIYPIGGASIEIMGPMMMMMGMWDGKDPHAGMLVKAATWLTLGVLMVDLQYPGPMAMASW